MKSPPPPPSSHEAANMAEHKSITRKGKLGELYFLWADSSKAYRVEMTSSYILKLCMKDELLYQIINIWFAKLGMCMKNIKNIESNCEIFKILIQSKVLGGVTLLTSSVTWSWPAYYKLKPQRASHIFVL